MAVDYRDDRAASDDEVPSFADKSEQKERENERNGGAETNPLDKLLRVVGAAGR